MKKLLCTLALIAAVQSYTQEDTVLELDDNQSMCITGKGAGQDGAINPYLGIDCAAIVKNLGDTLFDMRVEDKEGNYKITSISPKETKKVALAVGSVLYFDSEDKAKADVTFEEIK